MKKSCIIIFYLFCLGIGICNAQYTVLLNFNNTNGAWPFGDLTVSRSKLFGMTWIGGANGAGCIFSIDTSGNGYKDVWDFELSNTFGADPLGSLILVGNKLFGMTSSGGTAYDGNIFSIDTDGNGYIDLFDFNGTNGRIPQGSLIVSGKILYGMTEYGGLKDTGCIFSIDTNGNNYKDLLDFNVTNGAYPRGSLTLSGSKLFGMTQGTGLLYYGNIFTIDTDGRNYKTLLNFNGTNGREPQFGTLTLSKNMLYGMTLFGGVNDSGCVFSLDTNGNNYKDLFDFDGTNGGFPRGSLTLLGGKLFGMTFSGEANMYYGNIFSIDTNSNGYKDLFDFGETNGANPQGSLMFSGNLLYGMTENGGIDSFGVIFKIDTSTVASENNLIITPETINVYPNPNYGIFTVNCHYERSEESLPIIKIYNILAEQVLTETLQPQTPKGAFPKGIHSENSINISNQPNGVYFYRVMKEGGELIGEGKLVVEH